MAKVAKLGRIHRNWYADRYMSLIVQRNFLFLFAIISAFSILASLIVIKNLYEQRSIDPYFIEVEKQSNIITTVDQQSKAEYTAQESIKEYFFVNYIKARESSDPNRNLENDNNIIRLMSSKSIYEAFMKGTDNAANDAQNMGRGAVTTPKFRSISYLTSNRVKIRFMRETRTNDNSKVSTRSFTLILDFAFLDLHLSMEEMHVNPLGFQVGSYILQEERLFIDDPIPHVPATQQ